MRVMSSVIQLSVFEITLTLTRSRAVAESARFSPSTGRGDQICSRISLYFEHKLDLHARIQRQGVGADGGAGVFAGVAEDF